MISASDVVHDVQVFIDLWQCEAEKSFKRMDEIVKEYAVTPLSGEGDDYQLVFLLDGERYIWDFGNEELYRGCSDEGPEVTSGRAYDFATAYHGAGLSTSNAVEAEMDRRGWFSDPDEYEYYLSKGGWHLKLDYFPRSIKENAHDFVYEPDEDGYWCAPPPFGEIVHTARYQIMRDRNLLPTFRLSDLEKGMVAP
jgi:hypothetical protein